MMHPTAFRVTLLVSSAFLVIVAVWISAARLAARVDTHRLTVAEENGILQTAAHRAQTTPPVSAGRKEHP